MPIAVAMLPVTPFQQNCAFLFDQETKKGVIVDPGGDVPMILAGIEQIGMTVERILLTHGHMDHAGGAAELQRALRGTKKVRIEGPHKADAFLLSSLDKQGAKYGLQCKPVTPDRWLEEGDKVEIAGWQFDVLHCPGHTPGHVVFVSKEAGFAVVGDVLFRGSIGRTDFPYGDHAALLDAIKTKLWPLGDEITFICGHGPGGTFGEERRTNPFVGETA